MEKEHLLEFAYQFDLAQKDTKAAIVERYQNEIKTINNHIKTAAASGETSIQLTKSDIELTDDSAKKLVWYYSFDFYKTSWNPEQQILSVSWKDMKRY